MPEYTNKLNLPKPLGNEHVTRSAHNELVDAIDSGSQKEIAQGATAPSSPVADDLWLDTTGTPHILKRYDGTAWVKVGDRIKVDNETVFINDDGELTTINPNADDQTDVPGPKTLIAGTMDAGFFGEVHASLLMNGADLCNAIGLSQGNLQHSDEPFLKFAYKGKILFVNKKPIRNTVSWNAIASAGAVYGDGHSKEGNAQVTIDGLTYKVRLMKGAREDPADMDLDDKSTIGSEWNDLMYPIHVNADTGDWNSPQNVGNNVPDWGIGYTDEDLLTHEDFGGGAASWTQERGHSNRHRVYRGYKGVSYANERELGDLQAGFHHGARFVLELVD